jgi:hypothetical protein
LTSSSVNFSVGAMADNDGTVPVEALGFTLVVPLLVKRLFKNPVYDRPVEPVFSSVCRIVNGSSKHSISGLYNLFQINVTYHIE